MAMGAAEKLEPMFTEDEAARRLGVSKASLTRERLAGKIAAIRMGRRIIRYTDSILAEYQNKCRTAPGNLETTGSVSARAPTPGAERGTTPALDRQSAHRLALATFKPPKSSSPSGSSAKDE
jgi:hypothetical protein